MSLRIRREVAITDSTIDSTDAKIANGKILLVIPYTTHKINPVINVRFHMMEISLVDFVFKASITWGDSATATINPAR